MTDNLSLALFAIDPATAGMAGEISGAGYERRGIVLEDGDATATFGPAGTLWGLVTHVAVLDYNGNVLISGPLTIPKKVNPGDDLSIRLSLSGI
jgi:hypothetical protein